MWLSARSLLRRTEPCEDPRERVLARGNLRCARSEVGVSWYVLGRDGESAWLDNSEGRREWYVGLSYQYSASWLIKLGFLPSNLSPPSQWLPVIEAKVYVR